MTWERSFSYCYLFCNCLLTHRENMYLRHFVFIRLLFVFSKCLPTCCSNLITTMVTAKRGQELLTEGCWHARTNSGSAIKGKNQNKIKGITSKYSNKAYELVQRIFISLAICRYRLHRWDFLDKHVCGSRKCREYWYLWMFSLLAFTHSSQPIRQIKASKRLRAICRQIPFSHGVHINCSLNYLQWWKKCVNSKLLPDNSTERSVAQASRAQVHLPAAGGQGLCPSRVCLRPTTALKGTGRTFPLSPADLCNVENLHRPYPAALPLHCSCGGSDMPGQEMPASCCKSGFTGTAAMQTSNLVVAENQLCCIIMPCTLSGFSQQPGESLWGFATEQKTSGGDPGRQQLYRCDVQARSLSWKE